MRKTRAKKRYHKTPIEPLNKVMKLNPDYYEIINGERGKKMVQRKFKTKRRIMKSINNNYEKVENNFMT